MDGRNIKYIFLQYNNTRNANGKCDKITKMSFGGFCGGGRLKTVGQLQILNFWVNLQNSNCISYCRTGTAIHNDQIDQARQGKPTSTISEG